MADHGHSAYRNIRHFKIDLRKTALISKVAFALLYLLYEHAGGSDSNISLVNCSQEILDAFSASTMNTLLDIRSRRCPQGQWQIPGDTQAPAPYRDRP